MITYAKLAVLGIGLLFTAIAGISLYAQWGAVQEPVAVDLAALERGEDPPSRYVRIEDYVVRADNVFGNEYQYEAATTYEIFFPIVSAGHPAADAEVPLTQFAVVVRPHHVNFNDEGIPIYEHHGPLEGALAIGFDAMEGIEKDFLRETYPEVNVNKVHVLIPGDKPWISLGSWVWLGFGVIVTLVGAASFMMPSDD